MAGIAVVNPDVTKKKKVPAIGGDYTDLNTGIAGGAFAPAATGVNLGKQVAGPVAMGGDYSGRKQDATRPLMLGQPVDTSIAQPIKTGTLGKIGASAQAGVIPAIQATPTSISPPNAAVKRTPLPDPGGAGLTQVPAIDNPGAVLFKVTGGQTGTGYQPAVTLTKGNAGRFAAMNDARGVVADRPGNRPDLAKTVLSIADTASGTDLTADKGVSPLAIIRGGMSPAAASALHNRVDFSAGSANAKRAEADAKYKDEVAQAIRANAANGFAPTTEQMGIVGMDKAGLINLLTQNNRKGRYNKTIADLQQQQQVDQFGRKLDIAEMGLEADTDYKNRALAIDAPVKQAQAKQLLSEAKKNEFSVSPEGLLQEARIKGRDKEDEHRLKLTQDILSKEQDYFKSALERVQAHPEGMNMPFDQQVEQAKKIARTMTVDSLRNSVQSTQPAGQASGDKGAALKRAFEARKQAMAQAATIRDEKERASREQAIETAYLKIKNSL